MTRSEEHTLYDSWNDLHHQERATRWHVPMKQGKVQRLGRNWKGIEGEIAAKISSFPPHLNLHYADLPLAHVTREDVSWLRSNPVGGKIITDRFGTYEPDSPSFQTMQLRFNLGNQTQYWPAAFEENLHGIPTPELLNMIARDPNRPCEPSGTEEASRSERSAPNTSRCSIPQDGTLVQPAIPVELPQPKAGVNYMHFRGRGRDDEDFWCSGMLHALPSQNGVIGWQRITFMKHFDCNGEIRTSTLVPNIAYNGPELLDDIDRRTWIVPHDCWAFEGVVLPGGKIIVGK